MKDPLADVYMKLEESGGTAQRGAMQAFDSSPSHAIGCHYGVLPARPCALRRAKISSEETIPPIRPCPLFAHKPANVSRCSMNRDSSYSEIPNNICKEWKYCGSSDCIGTWKGFNKLFRRWLFLHFIHVFFYSNVVRELIFLLHCVLGREGSGCGAGSWWFAVANTRMLSNVCLNMK